LKGFFISAMPTYSEKLKSPKWQKKRLQVLERDEFRCQSCGDTETELHVHHDRYSKEPWDARDEELKTLCKWCHQIYEELKDSYKVIHIKHGDGSDKGVKYRIFSTLCIDRISGEYSFFFHTAMQGQESLKSVITISAEVISKLNRAVEAQIKLNQNG